MHMDTGELKKHKHDTISLLEIVSMEGRYYMVRFYLEGQGYLLKIKTKAVPKQVVYLF